MDRKKTIVAAAVINAGLFAALFIAAMTMREEPVSNVSELSRLPEAPKPLFEQLEPPAQVQVVQEAIQPPQNNQPLTFTLPPAVVEAPAPSPVEAPSMPLAVAAPPAAPAPAAPIAAEKTAPALEIEVQKGDTLERLAKNHRTSVDEIIKLNHLPSSFLRIGQKLKIPAEKSVQAVKPKVVAQAPSVEQAEYYTMKVGDNPWSIAMKHHIKVDELLRLNNLNEKSARRLKPGDRLRIR